MATRTLTRLPPVHALSAFESAARHNSFAVAAGELCITPSALSHRIRLLEDYTGERLFNRDGRAVSLSEFGRRYLDVVRAALRTLTDFPLPHKKAVSQPRVKITVPPTFTRCFLIPHLADFVQQYPEIILEAFLSVPLYDLSLSETDLEVRFGTGEYQDQVAEKLFEEPVFAVASPSYLEQIGGLSVPADLKRATLLRSPLEPWQPWFDAAGLDWPEPTTGFRVDDLGLLLEAVRHGNGVALTRKHFAQKAIAAGEVVQIFDVCLNNPPHAYYLVYEQQVLERPEVATFIAWLTATFKNIQ